MDNQSFKTYKLGDYYDDGFRQGVVFEVSTDGLQGKILSLSQSEKLQWSNWIEFARHVEDRKIGIKNQCKIQKYADWHERYPAFAWCSDQGDGWYLPAIDELKRIALNDKIYDAVNQTLLAKGGVKLLDRGQNESYWSSTEFDWEENIDCMGDMRSFALSVCMRDGACRAAFKYDSCYVRAVALFDSRDR